jgi:hypothetical protein
VWQPAIIAKITTAENLAVLADRSAMRVLGDGVWGCESSGDVNDFYQVADFIAKMAACAIIDGYSSFKVSLHLHHANFFLR